MNPADLFRHEEDLVRLAPGEQLFHEGDDAENMYVLLDGVVEITVRDHLLETAHAGALLGEMALIDHSPRSATAIAQTSCSLAKIDARRFDFLVAQTPHFARHVMHVMAQRLRQRDLLLR